MKLTSSQQDHHRLVWAYITYVSWTHITVYLYTVDSYNSVSLHACSYLVPSQYREYNSRA